MDSNRFDALARSIGNVGSRRAILRGLAAAGAATGIAGTERAAANGSGARTCRGYGVGCTRSSQCCSAFCNTQRTSPRSSRNRCVCPPNQTTCGGRCTDTAADAANCGACGHICVELADTCLDGECVCGDGAACDPATATGCVDGACTCGSGPACTSLQADTCTDGACTCGAGDPCGDNETCADGVCLPLTCNPVTVSAMSCVVTTNGEVAYGSAAGYFQNNSDEYGCDKDSDCTKWGAIQAPNPGDWFGCAYAADWAGNGLRNAHLEVEELNGALFDGIGACAFFRPAEF